MMKASVLVLLSLLGSTLGQAIIGNGKVILGVDSLGQLNIPYKAVTFSAGGVPLPATDPASIRVVGLRMDEYPFPPSTEPGCVCEGWGVKYVSGSSTYKGKVDNANGIGGVTLVSFTGVDGGTTATSVVTVSGGAKVTHAFSPSAHPNVYKVLITVENPSTVPYTSFIYRRQMDWDIYPTQFNEYVTIRGAAGHPKLVSSCDNGFVGGDIDTRSCITAPGYNKDYEDNGPADHGAYFDFEVGPIAAGKKVVFTMYYGAGKTYAEIDTAINSLPLEVLSYGKSNCGGPCNSKWTFAWGFSGTGGVVITNPKFTVQAPDAITAECGATITKDPATYFGGDCDTVPPTITVTESTSGATCPGTYVLTRTFTATTVCGETSTSTQTITVRDSKAPVITAPSTVTYETCTTPSISASATDACDSAATLTFTDKATTPSTCVGTGFGRTYTASDCTGNKATATVNVIAVDTTKPVITIPADIEVDCSGSTDVASTGTASATDCNSVTISSSDSVSGSGCPRVISRTFTATDKCGNSVSGVQKITVRPFCGDGNVQGAEQCDLGASNGAKGSCCTSTCTFATSAVVCRESQGLCDVVETCSGASDACPTDTFKPAGTACGEFFGMCDVAIEKSCTGTSPTCGGPPAFPAAPSGSWVDYNVISFDQFTSMGGDVEGRLAVKNKATLAGFTLGLELTLADDSWRKYSLFVAKDASWTDGSLRPDGVNDDVSVHGPATSGYVGGVASMPNYLLDRIENATVSGIESAVAVAAFSELQTYYTGIQKQLQSINTNAVATIQYGNGLLITCDGDSEVYHVSISAATFNKAQWTQLTNCKFSARWIVDITGDDDVVIQGQPFPAIVERVIYNVVGPKNIQGATGVAGHILAPNSNYKMETGVTYGIVVAGNVTFSRQNNKPNCRVFAPVTLSTLVAEPVKIGDTTIWVVDVGEIIPGDRVCINGDCQKVVGITKPTLARAAGQYKITLEGAMTASHASGKFATVTVTDPANRVDAAPVATSEEQEPDESSTKSTGSVVAVSAVALFAALAPLL